MSINTSKNLGYGSYDATLYRGAGVGSFLKKHAKKIGTALGGVALGALAHQLNKAGAPMDAPARDLDEEARQRRKTLMRRRQERINKDTMSGQGKTRAKYGRKKTGGMKKKPGPKKRAKRK